MAASKQLDVYATPFIPEAFTKINDCPATLILSPPLKGIDFQKYTTSFAGTSFLPPLPPATLLPLTKADQLQKPQDLGSANYIGHLQRCLVEEYEQQVHEVKRFNLYGVNLVQHDANSISTSAPSYVLNVPGLREDAPQVLLGDSVLLRQLRMDPATSRPWMMDRWLAQVAASHGYISSPAPGFTGVQHIAVVHGISKAHETLLLHVNGLAYQEPFGNLFNVQFIAQEHSMLSLQRSVITAKETLLTTPPVSKQPGIHTIRTPDPSPNGDSVGQSRVEELNRDSVMPLNSQTPNGHVPSQGISSIVEADLSSSWLRRMLFPVEGDGRHTSTPPSLPSNARFMRHLNYEQRQAVDAIRDRSYGNLPYLIDGPPGTGKTVTCCEAILQLLDDSSFTGSILIATPSDPAADHIALELLQWIDHDDIFRLNSYSRTFAEVPQSLLPICHIDTDQNLFSLPVFETLMQYRVVVTTCKDASILVDARVTNWDLHHLQQSLTSILDPRTSNSGQPLPLHWSALFLDEAAQATELEILTPLNVVDVPHLITPFQQPLFVLAGDKYQLGPRLYKRNSPLSVSLFERLSDLAIYARHPYSRKLASRPRPLVFPILVPPFTNLIRNYRSHPSILAFPSTRFYSDTLIAEARKTTSMLTWSRWQGRKWPVLFSVNGGIDKITTVATQGGGWYNEREAIKATAYAVDLVNSRLIAPQEICIMAAFDAQVRLLRKLCRAQGLHSVNIGPMEAFQGLESKVVIVCTTRVRSRFLGEDVAHGRGMMHDAKKINVAITRAKEGLIVLGNPWLLEKDSVWQGFMEFCWRNGLVEEEISEFVEGVESVNGSWGAKVKKTEVSGLERGLVFKEDMVGREDNARQLGRVSVGLYGEQTLYESGVAAEEALVGEM